MAKETEKLAREIDKSIAKGANDGLIRAFRNVDTDRVAKGARDTGDKWSSVFESRIGRHLKDAADSLPEFEPKVKLNRFDRAIAQTKRQLNDLSTSKIGPQGDVGLDQLGSKLDGISKRMHRLADEAKFADQKMRLLATAGQAESLKGMVDDARAQGLSDGRAFGGAFALGARQRIEQALKDLPEINLDADPSPAERAVAVLRAQLEALGEKKIGIDIDRDRFQQELSYIVAQIESLARDPKSIPLKYDLDQAAKGLRNFTDKVEPELTRQMGDAGDKGGERWAGAFANTVESHLRNAIHSVPNVPMTVDNTDAERALSAIRVEMETLADKKIGVDIDATAAQAKITELHTRLNDLDRDDVDIQVRTNAAAAAAQLALVKAATRDSSVSMAELGQNAGITMSRLGYMIAIGSSIGSLIGPAAAAAAVAVAGIGTAAASAAAGFGVLALGLYGISDAVKKIDAYQMDQNKSARSFSQAQNRVTTAVEGVTRAEQTLADTRHDAGEAAVEAQRRISDAQRNVAKAERDTADANIRAREQVANAEKAIGKARADAAESLAKARQSEKDAVLDLARTREDAHDSVARAVQSQRDAEKDLTRANQDQADARRDLNLALKDAVRDLRELDTAVARNGNEIDKAVTESMKAKLELDKIMTNPRSTEIEKRQAKEAFDDRMIQIRELKDKQAELHQQQEAAAKDGVESTDRVKKARQAVTTADERAAAATQKLADARKATDRAQRDAIRAIADAERKSSEAHKAVEKSRMDGLDRIQAAEQNAANARRDQQRTALDGAERIKDAQRAVAEAQRAAAIQQRNAQRQIQQQTQAVADAQRALSQAYQGVGVAGGEAYDNMNDALKKLSPAAQAFAKFIYGMKPQLDSLRRAAQGGLLPGLQDGIQSLVDTYLPSFEQFVGKIAKGLGDMFRATATVLEMPQWRAFFSFLNDHALGSLQGMWVATMNVARGAANIIRALNPLSAPMGQGLVDLTERFARWSDQLGSDTGFKAFMTYAQQAGPKVAELIERMALFVGRLVVAAAPIGDVVLKAAMGIFGWINGWDMDTLEATVEIIAELGTAIWVLTGFVRGVKFVTEAWNAISLVTAAAQKILAGAVLRYNTATAAATTTTGLLNGRLFATQGAGLAGAAGMEAMSAAAGPLGLALAGIGAIWYLNNRKAEKATTATQGLSDGFKQLGDAYDKVAKGSDTSGTAISDSLKQITDNNPNMQRAVTTLSDMGANIDDIAAAAHGSTEQLQKMMDLVDKRIAALSSERNKHFFDLVGNEKRDDQQEYLYKLKDQLKAAADQAGLSSQAMDLLNQSTQNVNGSTRTLTPAEQALAEAHRILGDKASTAKDKMDALQTAQDAVRQGARDAIEAEEAWNSSLLTLKTSVMASKAAHDAHAGSLKQDNETGLHNRDMLEDLIDRADHLYDSDVALNGVTEQAVKKGQAHYDQIRKVAKALDLNKDETEKLITSLGKIPDNVETAIGFKDDQFEKMFEQLEMAAYIQRGLDKGIDISTVKHDYKTMVSDRNRAGAHGWATGGPIQGPGITGGPKDDANLIWASKGEFMQNADAVNYYGPGLMHALNRQEIPKEMFPGFATGGHIGGTKATWPFKIDVSKTKIPSIEDLQAAIGGGEGGTGSMGGASGGRGWRWQIATLRKHFPGLDLYSGYRHSFTANGSLSWHGRDGGRAVDVPPRHDVFNFIHDTYGKDTKELIWLGDKYRNIHNGRHHVYDAHLLSQHGVAGMPNAHLHWAYDQGGYLPPGYSTVFNGTGKPEPVLTAPQWDAVVASGEGGGKQAPGHTYNIEFAENKLTIADLQAHQRRQETLDRIGRPR